MELVTVAILSIPVPRSARNWICREYSKLDLKKQMQPVLQAIGVGLVVAIIDGVSNLLSILELEKRDDIISLEDTRRYGDGYNVARHLDKEMEYKIERNLYLAAFAFTLLFVIGRLTDLMQEHAELEDELNTALQQQHEASSKMGSGTSTSGSSGKRTSQQGDDDNLNDEAGIEMKPIQSKKKD